MEFHQLAAFVAAAEEGSMSKAALREHVSQPALSRQIALLEARLGVPLFERRRQRIHLSEAGRFFLPRARQILCDAETSAQLLRERFGGARRTLRLGFIAPFLDDLVAPAIKELRRRRPRLELSLFELAPRAQIERLRAGELDAAILANLDAEDRARFEIRRLSRHRVALALPEQHHLARHRAVALAQLRRDEFVSLSDEAYPGRREFLRAACLSAGFEPRLVSEHASVSLMLAAVAAGEGVALVPRHAEKLPHAGCVFVALSGPALQLELVLVLPKRESDAELTLLAEVLAAKAARLDETHAR